MPSEPDTRDAQSGTPVPGEGEDASGEPGAAHPASTKLPGPMRAGYSENFARLMTPGGWRTFQEDGRRWAHEWLSVVQTTPPPTLEEARVHLVERARAARQLRPAFERFRRESFLWAVGPWCLGALGGFGARWLAAGNRKPVRRGPLLLSASLLAGEYGLSRWYARARGEAPGLAGVALSIPVGAALPAALPERVLPGRWRLTGRASATTIGAVVIGLAIRSFVEWPRRSDVLARLESPEPGRTWASDIIQVNFDAVHVPYTSGISIPLVIAIAITPEAFASRHAELEDLAAEVRREEWDTYHVNYLAMHIPMAPARRSFIGAGTDYMLMNRFANGVAVRQLSDSGAVW